MSNQRLIFIGRSFRREHCSDSKLVHYSSREIFTVHCSMYATGTRRSDITCPTISKTVDLCSLTSNLVCSRPYVCFKSWLLYADTCEDGPEVWHMFVVSQSWAGASGIYSDRLWSRRLPCMRLLLHIHMSSLLQTRHWGHEQWGQWYVIVSRKHEPKK
jgi:hypothetical protein